MGSETKRSKRNKSKDVPNNKTQITAKKTKLSITWFEITSLGIAIFACVAGWLALPSVQKLFESKVDSTVTTISTPTFTPTIHPTENFNIKDIPMVFVPSGSFTMGDDTSHDNEAPAHLVYVDDFYIDKFEVTNVLYEDCVNAGVCQLPKYIYSYTHQSYYDSAQYDSYPVIWVDWYSAKTYCEWRGKDTRLPTEAEWEKTSRGVDSRTYPWGEDIDCKDANYYEGANFSYIGHCVGDTTPIGSYQINKSIYGVYDMAGNVWEWVADWYKENYYETLDVNSINPTGPQNGSLRVIRGGSWSYYESDARSARREPRIPTNVYNDVGFRCASTTTP